MILAPNDPNVTYSTVAVENDFKGYIVKFNYFGGKQVAYPLSVSKQITYFADKRVDVAKSFS
jgi:ribosomal protein S6